MNFFMATPALVKQSLHARSRGQKPHLPEHLIDRCILSWWDTDGRLPRVSKKDIADSKVVQRKNNRINASLRAKTKTA